MAKDTIDIEVSKDNLDAFWHSRTEACCLPNTPEGFGQLCDWLGKEQDVLIVFDETGAYHRGLEIVPETAAKTAHTTSLHPTLTQTCGIRRGDRGENHRARCAG